MLVNTFFMSRWWGEVIKEIIRFTCSHRFHELWKLNMIYLLPSSERQRHKVPLRESTGGPRGYMYFSITSQSVPVAYLAFVKTLSRRPFSFGPESSCTRNLCYFKHHVNKSAQPAHHKPFIFCGNFQFFIVIITVFKAVDCRYRPLERLIITVLVVPG